MILHDKFLAMWTHKGGIQDKPAYPESLLKLATHREETAKSTAP
jgi:hypothetical protein